ncbi:MAG TPA: hypothetical protein VHW64_18660 [Nocardioides sp.]|uniref:hypothetical protein n=1 Tax=Nocardioides sp. TaxID=35761 RepID=UPI002E32BF96|nr:hypothetical protein [Nocardioides sp.]HEX3932725.1 hypothetical protein [Nocardioides sp.]
MNLRRSLALGAAGLAVTAALSACGLNYPTDRINNLVAGVDYRNGPVDILNAVVVAKGADTGTFVATFVNNSPGKAVSMQTASGDNTSISTVDAPSFTLKPGSMLNLAADKGFPVSGTFAMGQFVNLSFQFDNGETATISVPVVADCGQWAGLDVATPSPGATSSDSASPSTSAAPSDTPSESPSALSCS